MVSTAVILAAGMGSRLGETTRRKPKGFLEINQEPIIERSIKILLESGLEKIIIGTGYLAHFYKGLKKRYPGIETVQNGDYASTGSFYTLYNMRKTITDDFLLLESDLLYEKRAVTYLRDRSAPDIILASGRTHSGDEVYIETDSGGHLVNMSKNKADLSAVYGELVGISKLSATAFKRMTDLYRTDEAGCRKIEYETALVNLARKLPLRVDILEDLVWTEIDTEAHLKRAVETIYPRLEIRN